MRCIGPGSPEPLGLTLVPGGANVAVFSAHANAIEWCLFDAAGQVEIERIALPERSGDVFHGFVSGIGAGDRYGLRAHGPYDLRNGHRFNPTKLLVDPYARAIDRRFVLHPTMFGELPDGTTRNDADSAPFVPKGIATASFNEAATIIRCHGRIRSSTSFMSAASAKTTLQYRKYCAALAPGSPIRRRSLICRDLASPQSS